eukprot:TRINITY_DN1660_c0_g1_i1.p1 TRINITY_DN1660_c0_g1~~TRINITY_DN1660_c0_g1_i1.p1  ORF type:complete len:185 (+),score=34.28 TRINITY_DN1660_c0_g1_i1:45-599(+)
MGQILDTINPFNKYSHPSQVLLLGLDAAGKTTFLYKLRRGDVETTIPTIGFNVESLEFQEQSIVCWDVGGRMRIRALWRHYYVKTDALIFMIDGNDRERIPDAIQILESVVEEDDLAINMPVAVVINKNDLPNCLSSKDIEKMVQKFLPQGGVRPVRLFETVAIRGDGINEVNDWILNSIHCSK